MRKLGFLAAILVVVLLLAAVGLSFLLDANRFKPELESELAKVLGRDVKLGELKFSIFSGNVSADDLSIAEDPKFGTSPFLQAKSFNVGAELMPLILSRKLNVTGITIDQPQIVLLQTAEGTWNFS